MNDSTIQFISELMLWTGMMIFAFAVLCLVFDWFCSKLIDAIWPPCHEEVARREAVMLIKKANRCLFKNRVRRMFRVLRFWNV